MLDEILTALKYVIGFYVLLHVTMYILKFFKELFEETWQLWVGYAVLIIVIFALQQLYVFDNLLGVSAFVLVFVFLVCFLHKKMGIVRFLKIFTGIDEYNKEDKFWKKILKILRISFTIIIFTSIALGMFVVLIETIFLHSS